MAINGLSNGHINGNGIHKPSATPAPSTSAWNDPAAIKASWETPEQSIFNRTWTPELIASLRSPFPEAWPASTQGTKLRKIFAEHAANKTGTLSVGATGVLSAHSQAEVGFETIYVSGAICSLTDTATGDLGADMADYSYDTVPNKVDQIFRGQVLHARLNNLYTATPRFAHKSRSIDYLPPIIADADTGHGGPTATMKLTKCFVEAGAAAIHLDDQVPGTKKYGAKTAGRVLVPITEHVQRLSAIKLQFDVMGVDCLIIHRTDAETAGYLTSTIDARDRPFVLGTTNSSIGSMLSAKDEDEWEAAAKLCSLDEAVAAFTDAASFASFTSSTAGLRVSEALLVAQSTFPGFFWSCESPRSKEGWYRFNGNIEAAIVRSIACAQYADMLWTRTPATVIPDLEKFAKEVLEAVPGKWLGYNLAMDVAEDKLSGFVEYMGKLGYTWQFLPLTGMHAEGLGSFTALKSVLESGLAGAKKDIYVPGKAAGASTLTKDWMAGDLADVTVGALACL